MAVIFLILALILTVVAILVIFDGDGNDHHVRNGIIVAVIAAIFIITPCITNGTPTSMQHHVVRTDNYDGMSFERVKRIEYDTYKYNWWTFGALTVDTEHNLMVYDDISKQGDK